MTATRPQELQLLLHLEHPPSPEQLEAITAPLEPGVVIAGAGSGKTSVMASRVVWLVVTEQVRSDQILGLTFTNKAANELSHRVRSGLQRAGVLPDPSSQRSRSEEQEDVLEPTVSTYNAYAASLLVEHGLRIGHEPDTRLLADATRYQLAGRVVARYDGEVALLSDSPRHVIDWLLKLDSELSEHLCSPDALRTFDVEVRRKFCEALAADKHKGDLPRAIDAIDKRQELLGLVEAYRETKKRLGVMEFSDQIELGYRLASTHPDVGRLERERYRVVLLDEYQDTSVAQARMLRALFSGDSGDSGDSGGRGHPVTAVGDPNQAIYGWRGASVANILSFRDHFPLADGSPGRLHRLTTNWRSDERILTVANRLGEPLRDKTPHTDPLVVAPGMGPGDVRVAVHLTYDEELRSLPERVRAAYAGVAGGSWKNICVLTRDNATAADVFHALSREDIPVEIVGLKGLLALPEVSQVVATLTLLHDMTANSELLTLLSGPRWAIGPRDLALLGRRAQHLTPRTTVRADELSLDQRLREDVSGVDPTDVLSLVDALESPGDSAYSPEARERFGLLAAELRMLRRHASEPLLDLVRRIIDTIGIDVELASSVSKNAGARRDNLDLFVKAVAEFQAVDGDVTLPALLAYLEAEDDFGAGLDVATPSETDSVKLLTVHRAKGLEYDAVFLVGVARDKFPPKMGRTRWVTGACVLPNPLRGDRANLPELREHTRKGIEAFQADAKEHDAVEERRLGYVAFTRARHVLEVSSYVWHPDRSGPNGPSEFQRTARDAIESWGGDATPWLDTPPRGETNPIGDESRTLPWPSTLRSDEVTRRLDAAALIQAHRGAHAELSDVLSTDEATLVTAWDAELARLVAEAQADRAQVVDVALPSSLSATRMAQLRDDPASLAAELARPMPRQPSPAARFGTRFHAWVEAHLTSETPEVLVDPEDLPGRGDADIVDDSELAELVEKFRCSPFWGRTAYAVEPPFALVLAGQVVRGRIDAVFAEDDGGYLVVDWKTNRQHTADPQQLALYRVAWAELRGVPVEKVRAAFYYVRDGELVAPASLATRTELEELVLGQPSRAASPTSTM